MGCINETPLGRSPTFKQLQINDRTAKIAKGKGNDSLRITPLSSQASHIMSSSKGIRISKDFTLPEEQTLEEKRDQVRQLMSIRKKGKDPSDLSLLFQYFVDMADIHKEDLTQVKSEFRSMSTWLLDNLVTRQEVAQIIVDALDQSNRMKKVGEENKFSKLVETMQESRKEMFRNPRFINRKWERQAEDRRQMEQNLLAIKNILEEESRERKSKAKAEAEGWECPVCISDIDRDSIGILECGHIFHPECIQAYLKQKIQNNEIQIHCPMDNCSLQLDPQDIFHYVDQTLKEKYQKFAFNNFVEDNDEVSWCPTINCPAVFIAQPENDNYYCPTCRYHYCLRCRSFIHRGMTCAEYRVTHTFSKNDQEFLTFVKGAKFKQCPKCDYWVERNQGCNSMSCRCGQNFCYRCGAAGGGHSNCNVSRPSQ